MAINDKKVKYDSGINVLGSIPDYGAMLEFICEYTGKKSESEQAFSFRTHKTFNRFLAAIKASILQFANDDQKTMFLSAISSDDFSVREKLLVLFWQLVYGNALFAKVTKEVFMRAVYQGRTSLSVIDVLSLLHHIKETEESELNWSEETLKITASKYLTMLKKMNLAEGKTAKDICTYHYRTAVCLFYPLDNSYMSREQDVGKSICHLWVYGQEKHYREIKKS